MNVNSAMESQIQSVRQAMGTASMEQAMNRDGATVGKLIEGMEETSESIKEAQESKTPHLGNNIDVKV